MISYIIKINGAYDILCALSILKIINLPFFKDIHLSMFIDKKKNPLFERFLGYWILTYGIIRIYNIEPLTSLSYAIEAIVVANETYVQKTIYKTNGLPMILKFKENSLSFP